MDNPQVEKLDENKIRVIKTMPVQIDYTYEYLIQQKQRITEQKDREMAQRDAEIAEIDALLAECDRLDVKPLPAPETPQEDQPTSVNT